MSRRSKVAPTYSVNAESVLPKVTFSTVAVKRRKGNLFKPNIAPPQDAFMITASAWDSMPEAENTWTPNLDPTEQETVHVVHSRRRGGKVSVLLSASNYYKLLIP
jgi:hypothetical protein